LTEEKKEKIKTFQRDVAGKKQRGEKALKNSFNSGDNSLDALNQQHRGYTRYLHLLRNLSY
jgi:hypothetical protein